MATPLTAGAAALVRDWYNDQKSVANPSSALIKATLVNGASAIAPGQYGGGTTQEIPSVTPNNAAGWGRVNLANAVSPRQSQIVASERRTSSSSPSRCSATAWCSRPGRRSRA